MAWANVYGNVLKTWGLKMKKCIWLPDPKKIKWQLIHVFYKCRSNKHLSKTYYFLFFLIFSFFFFFCHCVISIQNLSWLNPPWLEPLLRLGKVVPNIDNICDLRVPAKQWIYFLDGRELEDHPSMTIFKYLWSVCSLTWVIIPTNQLLNGSFAPKHGTLDTKKSPFLSYSLSNIYIYIYI